MRTSIRNILSAIIIMSVLLCNAMAIEKENIIKLVLGFEELPLFGKMGLKHRTGLIEFRYDKR